MVKITLDYYFMFKGILQIEKKVTGILNEIALGQMLSHSTQNGNEEENVLLDLYLKDFVQMTYTTSTMKTKEEQQV